MKLNKNIAGMFSIENNLIPNLYSIGCIYILGRALMQLKLIEYRYVVNLKDVKNLLRFGS